MGLLVTGRDHAAQVVSQTAAVAAAAVAAAAAAAEAEVIVVSMAAVSNVEVMVTGPATVQLVVGETTLVQPPAQNGSATINLPWHL